MKNLKRILKNRMNSNELEKVKTIGNLINYMAEHCDNYTNMVHKFNDISISVHGRRPKYKKKERVIESISIMKEYLKDTSKEIHIVVNEYYEQT